MGSGDYYAYGGGSGSGSGMGSGYYDLDGGDGPPPTCEEIIAAVDLDKNGVVPVEEFTGMGNCHSEEDFYDMASLAGPDDKITTADCLVLVDLMGAEVLKSLGEEAMNPKCGGPASAKV
jgi:hypothetical protein